MSVTTLLIFGVFGVAFLAGLAFIIWNELFRSHAHEGRKGVEPGRGVILIANDISVHNGSHSTAYRVTNDPLQYAKGMMPGNRK